MARQNDHPWDSWPPKRVKQMEDKEPKKPKNKSYVDFYTEIAKSSAEPVFEGEEETVKEFDTEDEKQT